MTNRSNNTYRNFAKSAALAAALSTAPALVAADVTVYGRAHVSVDYLDDGQDYSELNMSSNSSRLGFKGDQEFDGITAFFQLEQEIDFSDTGSSLASRDTFVGVRGDFGSLRFGKFDTPFKSARGPANLFGDQMGDIRNLTRVGDGRFDERTPNTIHYQTPALGAARVNIAYSLHEGNSAVLDDEGSSADQGALSLSLTYKDGPIDFALAFESFDADRSRGERQAARLAVGYSLTSTFKLVGFYQTVDHQEDDTQDADVIGLGGEFKLSSTMTLRGHYMMRQADPDNADSNMVTLGLEHRFASPLRAYVNLAMVDNDDNAGLSPWAQARTTNAAAASGETATGLSFGLRYDF